METTKLTHEFTLTQELYTNQWTNEVITTKPTNELETTKLKRPKNLTENYNTNP